MQIDYLGHSCFLFEWKGYKILVDPFITKNPLVKNINIDSIRTDYILITHGHYDHIADVEQICQNNPGVQLIANYEVATWFENKGIKATPMNHGGKKNFEFGTIKLVNAVHSSSLPDGSYGGNAVGFVLWDKNKCFYIAGDTALHHDMKLIPIMCPQLNFAILPIGDCFTMGYEDAIIACNYIECKKIIGCHFDTFELITIEKETVRKAFEDKGIYLKLPKIGESFEL